MTSTSSGNDSSNKVATHTKVSSRNKNYVDKRREDNDNSTVRRETLILPAFKNVTPLSMPSEGLMYKSESDCMKIAAIIQLIETFKYHTQEELMEIIMYMYSVNVPIGGIVCHMKEEKTAFYVIISGEFVIRSINKSSSTVVVKVQKENGYFGVTTLTDESNSNYEVMAQTQGQLFGLAAFRFHWLKQQAAQRNTKLIKYILSNRHLFPNSLLQLGEHEQLDSFRLCDLEVNDNLEIPVSYHMDTSNQTFHLIYIVLGEAKLIPKSTDFVGDSGTGKRVMRSFSADKHDTKVKEKSTNTAHCLYELKANHCVDIVQIRDKLETSLEDNMVTLVATVRCILFVIKRRNQM